MTLTTQDGRTIDISREYSPFISGYAKNDKHPATVTLTLFTKSKIVERCGIIGTYMTDTGRDKAADMLRAAWQSGATEFTMPQDTFEKSATEVFDDFCEKHGLTLATADETAIGLKGCALGEARRLAHETDYWERHNVLIADENGDYSKSFAKWKALRRTA